MQIARAICTVSCHLSRLCLYKEGQPLTTSYLIKTFSNLTVSCASDFCCFLSKAGAATRLLTHFLIFSFWFGWVCHDQELLNLFITTAYTRAFLTNVINCIVKKMTSEAACHLQLEGEAGEAGLAQGSPSPVTVTETQHGFFHPLHHHLLLFIHNFTQVDLPVHRVMDN